MTLNEAIEMLNSILKDRRSFGGGYGDDAIKLGIEALRIIQLGRQGKFIDIRLPLPGETK